MRKMCKIEKDKGARGQKKGKKLWKSEQNYIQQNMMAGYSKTKV